jgi:RNA polymerase sigma factor (sigma-70 family)
MENKQLEQWVLESKTDKQKLNNLLEVYKPFIMSCTQRISGRFLRYGSDDELTIAMMAFTKAVERYIPAHGDFLNFARSIIRSRVIDYYRSQNRHSKKVVYLQQEEEETDDSVEAQASLTVYSEEKCRNDSIKFLAGSLLLLIIAFFSGKNEVFKWIGAIFALLYREIMYQHALYRERKKQPLYTVAQRGLRILEIVPDGTAEKMKMKRGEIILTVNGKPVQTEDGIRHVLAKSPTFIWMHTEALNGQIKIYEHKCYPDGVKDLGVILVPKEWEVTYQVDEYENFTIIKNIVDKFRFKR